jgi:hypothetical protein
MAHTLSHRGRSEARGSSGEVGTTITVDVPADDGSTCRYCLAQWVQSGRSAVYSFLYRV